MTTRQLLAMWNAQARGALVVQTIRRALEEGGLITEPDFASGYIDNQVGWTGAPAEPVEPATAQEVSLKVGHLRAASQPVMSVRPDASLATAQTLMVLHDFSQLA